MPSRQTILSIGEIYHVYNRGNAARDVFLSNIDYERFLKTMSFYRFKFPSFSLSKFLTLSSDKQKASFTKLETKSECLVEIFCFCLMPNHFHFLLKQVSEVGVSKFVGQLQNSYTRYFNTKKNRVGALFQGQFKAKRVVSERQLIHLSRYIHLNPYSSFLIKSIDGLSEYNYSSFSDYVNKRGFDFINKKYIIDIFGGMETYKKFVFDQANYQRELSMIKSLIIE